MDADGEARSIEARRKRALVFGIVVASALISGLLRLPYLSVPLERDEGEYAYIAQRLAHGDVVYRDAFDQKPPGIFAAYRVAFALFGASVEGIHLFLHVWTVLSALALFLLVRDLAGSLAAAFAVLALGIWTADPRIVALAANTEMFMIFPLLASTLCLVRALADGGARWWIACGAAAAAACWFKQVAATQLVFVLGAALWGPGVGGASRAISRTLRAWGLLGAGVALFSVPVLGVLAWSGAFGAFLDAVLLHNFAYSSSLTPGEGWARLRGALTHQAPSFWVLWLLAAPALCWPGLTGRRTWAVLAGFFVSSALGTCIGFYFRPHYFVQVLPALCGSAGIGLGVLAGRFLVGARPTLAWLAVCCAVAAVATPPLLANRDTHWAGSPTAIARRIYGINPFPEALRIGEHIRRTSEPDESVYIVGSEPEILFYAERRSATRYIFFYPLTGSLPGVLDRQREVVAEIERSRPRYVVWVNLTTSLPVGHHTERHVFEATAALLAREYELEFVAHPVDADSEYQFSYGAEGRWLLRAAGARAGETPWIAVYRRTS